MVVIVPVSAADQLSCGIQLLRASGLQPKDVGHICGLMENFFM